MTDELAALIEELEELREQAIGDRWQLTGVKQKRDMAQMTTPSGIVIEFPQIEVTGQFRTAQEGSMRVITPYKEQVDYINLLVENAPKLIRELQIASDARAALKELVDNLTNVVGDNAKSKIIWRLSEYIDGGKSYIKTFSDKQKAMNHIKRNGISWKETETGDMLGQYGDRLVLVINRELLG